MEDNVATIVKMVVDVDQSDLSGDQSEGWLDDDKVVVGVVTYGVQWWS